MVRIWLLGLWLLSSAAPLHAEQLPGFVQSDSTYVAADPAATPVTAENVLERERFWPPHVELESALEREGTHTLKAGTTGVLVHVKPDRSKGGIVRIDFGRDGRADVPLDRTDLIERANRVRLGELHKGTALLTLALGTKLAKGEQGRLTPVVIDEVGGHAAYLLVFADLAAPEFPEVSRQLAALQARRGLYTILLPQGDQHDRDTLAKLEEHGWSVPFVLDQLAEGYRRAYLGDASPLPSLMLMSEEGRVLFEGAPEADGLEQLTGALDAAGVRLPETARN